MKKHNSLPAVLLILLFLICGCGQNPASSSNTIVITRQDSNYFMLSNGIKVYGARDFAQEMADSMNLLGQKYLKGYNAVKLNLQSIVVSGEKPKDTYYAWVNPTLYIDAVFFQTNYVIDDIMNAGVLVHETTHITDYKKYGSALSRIQMELNAYSEERNALRAIGARDEYIAGVTDVISSLERGETKYTAARYLPLPAGD